MHQLSWLLALPKVVLPANVCPIVPMVYPHQKQKKRDNHQTYAPSDDDTSYQEWPVCNNTPFLFLHIIF